MKFVEILVLQVFLSLVVTLNSLPPAEWQG